MSEEYFYQERGKTLGPFPLEEMRARIQAKRVRLFDLILKEGESQWRLALEYPNLRGEFGGVTVASLKERPWVVLQKKAGGAPEFTTIGPFTQEEIDENLKRGEVSYSDYAWKDNFADWKRIGTLEEFNPRLRTPAAPVAPVVVQESAAELLKNVLELRRLPAPAPEIPPSDALRLDLTQGVVERKSGASAPIMSPRITKSILPRETEGELEKKPRRSQRSQKNPMLDWGLVGVLALVLLGVVLIASRFYVARGPIPVPEAPAPEAVAVKPVLEKKPPSETVELTQYEKPEPVEKLKAPTTLELTVKAGGTTQAHIDIRTDGSKGFPVFLQIVGLPGQVSEGGGVFRHVRLQAVGHGNKALVVPDSKLPEGKYILHVESGDLEKDAKLNLGMGTSAFKSAVARQRKLYASALWKERLTLFKLSEAFESELRLAIAPAGKFAGKGLQPVSGVKRSNGANYLMFEDWWELHEIYVAAKNDPNATLLNRLVKERDHLSVFSVWK